MSISEEIVKTALLGTEKYPWSPDAALGETGAAIQSSQADREDGFLRYAAAALVFESAGCNPAQGAEVVPECPAERLPEMPERAASWLVSALATGDEVLLDYLLYQAQLNGEIVPPTTVPAILDLARKESKKNAALIAVAGERGKWLIGINPLWNPLVEVVGEASQVDWETGTHEQRKAFIIGLRKADPAAAIPLLQSAFPAENANNRMEFLELLQEGLNRDDEPFLVSLLSDKSKKVKETATELLRSLPGSAMSELYLAHARQALQVREQRYLLVSKKKVLEIDPKVQPSEALFATGIEKVSSTKGVQDYVHWLGQVLAYVSPVALFRHLGLSATEFYDLFSKVEGFENLRPYLVQSATRFRDVELARVLLGTGGITHMGLLNLLPEQERAAHYPSFAKADVAGLVQILLSDDYAPIPRAIAKGVLEVLAASPYQIHQPTYRRLAMQLTQDMVPWLREYSQRTAEDYGQTKFFATQATEMMRLLEIKESLKRT